MASFVRIGDFFGASLITGPSSAFVQLRFSPEHVGPPVVVLLASDTRFGDAPSDLVARAVESAVAEANSAFGSDHRVAEVRYQSDNDGLCSLVRSASYRIVHRLAEDGPDAFSKIL